MKLRKKRIKDVEEPDIAANIIGDRVPSKISQELYKFASEVGRKAMKVAEEIYPEDIFLLWLSINDAVSPERALEVPTTYVTAMYTLWTEGFIGHTYDERVYLTPQGMRVVNILKMKLAGDKRWKKYL